MLFPSVEPFRAFLATALTFSHNILFKDQKKSREKVEQRDEHLRARFGCRAIRPRAFSSLVARPLCVPNSLQSGLSCANTAAWSTDQQAPLLWPPPRARSQWAASGSRAARGSAERSLAVARVARRLGPAVPASAATPRNFAPGAARPGSLF